MKAIETRTNRTTAFLLSGASLLLLAACGGGESADDSAGSQDMTEMAEDIAMDEQETQSSGDEGASEGGTEEEPSGPAEAEMQQASSDDSDEQADTAPDEGSQEPMEQAADESGQSEEATEMAEAAVADEDGEDAAADDGTSGDDGEQQMAAASSSSDLPPDHPALGGDPQAGRRVFAKCMSCHAVQPGQNRVGPSLYGIVGREAGTVEGFNYSEANSESGVTWTKDVLFEYLKDPRGFMPGTKMIFPGLPSEEDRRDVIAYLDSVDDE